MPDDATVPGQPAAGAASSAGATAHPLPAIDAARVSRTGPWLALSVQARQATAAVGTADKILARAADTDLTGAAGESAPAANVPTSRHGLAVIELALARAGVRLDELAGLSVTDGPGPFTAIRVAMSLIQGIGIGCRLPVIPVPSLAALASTAERAARLPAAEALAGTAAMGSAPALVLTALDARMNECYFGAWRVVPGHQPVEMLVGGVGHGSTVQPAFEALIDRLGSTADVAGAADAADAAGGAARLILAGSGFRSDAILADWASTLAATRAAQPTAGSNVVIDLEVEADAVDVLATALLPTVNGNPGAWQAISPTALRPRYVRDKVALDVDEQRRLAAARDAASSRG